MSLNTNETVLSSCSQALLLYTVFRNHFLAFLDFCPLLIFPVHPEVQTQASDETSSTNRQSHCDKVSQVISMLEFKVFLILNCINNGYKFSALQEKKKKALLIIVTLQRKTSALFFSIEVTV